MALRIPVGRGASLGSSATLCAYCRKDAIGKGYPVTPLRGHQDNNYVFVCSEHRGKVRRVEKMPW